MRMDNISECPVGCDEFRKDNTLWNELITLFRYITMLRGIENIPIHSPNKEYSMKYFESHVILLWI